MVGVIVKQVAVNMEKRQDQGGLKTRSKTVTKRKTFCPQSGGVKRFFE
jgi:hypothetical protein